ncbi:uncharacterized protein LOC132740669 [Ruditapes philippinarum]|uniref:uncharacterized protein LOC132740669 n=1 Tax=Ruditapes philippinarum TaxID=129788 RepID=UPI00295BA894|nr:uncharacterized protein LOC132740669 [Ruditapes philippinarum]
MTMIPDKSYSWGVLIGCVLLVATAHAFSHHSKTTAREKGRMSDPENDDIILSHEHEDDSLDDLVDKVIHQIRFEKHEFNPTYPLQGVWNSPASKKHFRRGRREADGTATNRMRRSRKCNMARKHARTMLQFCQSEPTSEHKGAEKDDIAGGPANGGPDKNNPQANGNKESEEKQAQGEDSKHSDDVEKEKDIE